MKIIRHLILLLFLPGGFFSCKKYPDGPLLSLHSKKNRLENTWKVSKVYKSGDDITDAYFQNIAEETFAFRKDYSFEYLYSNVSFSGPAYGEIGTWAFTDNKKKITVTPSPTSNTQKILVYTILKLEKKELWIEEQRYDSFYQFHLIPK